MPPSPSRPPRPWPLCVLIPSEALATSSSLPSSASAAGSQTQPQTTWRPGRASGWRWRRPGLAPTSLLALPGSLELSCCSLAGCCVFWRAFALLLPSRPGLLSFLSAPLLIPTLSDRRPPQGARRRRLLPGVGEPRAAGAQLCAGQAAGQAGGLAGRAAGGAQLLLCRRGAAVGGGPRPAAGHRHGAAD